MANYSETIVDCVFPALAGRFIPASLVRSECLYIRMKSILSYLARISPLILLCSLAGAQTAPTAQPVAKATRVTPETMPVSDVHRGMRGVAYTVFEGTKPEPMDVEVLGVLPNLNGPKSDLILARLHGEKVEYTGVVAGMSGSPVYIDGKLVGAISYRIGQFSKEPICGITPIEDMLEIDAMDRSQPEQVSTARAAKTMSKISNASNSSPDLQSFASMMQPIDAPFVFSGFTESTIRQFASQFAAAGLVPVM